MCSFSLQFWLWVTISLQICLCVRITWSQISETDWSCIISLLQETISLISHDLVAFWNKQGTIFAWIYNFNTTFLSYTDLLIWNILCVKILFLSNRTTQAYLPVYWADNVKSYTAMVAPIEALNMIILCYPVPIFYFDMITLKNSIAQSILFQMY